ncbi:hypothetical protein ACSSS7_003611 [Eimeria intestinalis]
MHSSSSSTSTSDPRQHSSSSSRIRISKDFGSAAMYHTATSAAAAGATKTPQNSSTNSSSKQTRPHPQQQQQQQQQQQGGREAYRRQWAHSAQWWTLVGLTIVQVTQICFSCSASPWRMEWIYTSFMRRCLSPASPSWIAQASSLNADSREARA